jgi:uncharacterized protein (DUF2236 family)
MEEFRLALAKSVIQRVRGDAPPPRERFSGEPGWFGPESAAWIVHSDLATLLGGIRALLLQSLHPLPMAAVRDHSNFRNDPWGRVQRTATFIATTVFGSEAEAADACARLRSIHDHITGVTDDGVAYRANDPHLLEWVHVAEIDSFLTVHQRYGAQPLSPERQDSYVAEMSRVARELGVIDPPMTVAALRQRLLDFRPELERTDASAQAARFVLIDPPLPLATRPAYGVLAAAAYSSLPFWAQAMIGPPIVGPVEPLAVRPAARAVLGLLRWSMRPEAA